MKNAIAALPRMLTAQASRGMLGFLLGLAVLGIAVVVLLRLLHDVNLRDVGTALAATPSHKVFAAIALVACAYVTLTFYDYFSLRTIGRRDLPYRLAAFAGFTSYCIGHNIGATVFTGGTVRYRIYSRYGLTLIDVAKIAFVTGLTFWLGNAFVLGAAFSIEPQAASAVNALSPQVNRLLGLASIACIVIYLLWIAAKPRAVGRNGWRVELPNAPLTLVQIGIGVLDLGVSSLAMYVLMPDVPGVDFLTLLVVFVFATLLGFASHAPGSLGVFEAAMLIALPQFAKADLLASMLLFRVIYYVGPFAIALLALGIHECVVMGDFKDRDGKSRRDESP